MTDAACAKLIRNLGYWCRRKTLDSLMVGNDTRCFTTDQYRQRYVDVNWKGDRNTLMFKRPDLARQHLVQLGCREVEPDVWTVCPTCDGTGVLKGDASAPVNSILRVDVPCPECREI